MNQVAFFEQLTAMMPEGMKVPQLLQDSLKISRASAYKKMNGHVALSFDDIAKMSALFPLTIYALPKALNIAHTTVTQNNFFEGEEGFKNYLKRVIGMFGKLSADAQLTYIARDFPLFFFLKNRLVLSFKLSLWNDRLLQDGLLPVDDETAELAEMLFLQYLKVPSTEIWYKNMVQHFMEQLNYALEADLMNHNMYNKVLNGYKETMKFFQDMANNGTKRDSTPFQLYVSPYCTANNFARIQTGDMKWLFVSVSGIQHLLMTDDELHNAFQQNYHSLLRTSTLLSSTSTKERNDFFNPQGLIKYDNSQ